MNLKYKLTILTIVVLTAISILLIPNRVHDSPDRSEPAETAVTDQVEHAAEAQFEPTADPYGAFVEARLEGKPIVLEFYARW